MNGPSPAISDGGVVGPQASASVPSCSAGSSRWRGRMGRLSSRRRPGPNGDGKPDDHRRVVGAPTPRGACRRRAATRPAGCRSSRRRPPGTRRARRPHVNGAPSEKVTPVAQLQRVDQAVGRHRPGLGQPRLELLGGAVDADELGLRQIGDRVGDRVAPDGAVAVEGARLAPDGRDQGAAAQRGWCRGAPGPGRSSQNGRRRQHDEEPGSGDSDPV